MLLRIFILTSFISIIISGCEALELGSKDSKDVAKSDNKVVKVDITPMDLLMRS